VDYQITSNIIRFEEGEECDGKPSWNAMHSYYDYPDSKKGVKIGVLKWDLFIEEYCYHPECPWWHEQIILSDKLLNEITKFIRDLKTQ